MHEVPLAALPTPLPAAARRPRGGARSAVAPQSLTSPPALPRSPAPPLRRHVSARRARRCAPVAAEAASSEGAEPGVTPPSGFPAGAKPPTPILDTVNFPVHMKNLSIKQLEQLAEEIRRDVIYTVSKTGGHLSSSLGVVELTVALHYVFDCPKDNIVFDVGHQAYPHKILTGRRDRMHTIRQTGGLSGFTKRSESEYDPFGAGHSSTSISAALGMAAASDMKGDDKTSIAVIGDGAMTGGMAYEALNNAGFLDKNMIVILNDNKQVSLPTANLDPTTGRLTNAQPVGALSGMLTRLQSNKSLREIREIAKGVTKQMGPEVAELTAKVDEYARGLLTTGERATMFEELGMYYIGPIDGHSMQDLVDILTEIKNTEAVGPVLLHVMSEKGRGYSPAVAAADRMHGVVPFDVETGKQNKKEAATKAYTTYFAEGLIAEAAADERIVAIHAAMGGGTGLNLFQKRFPDRTFDVGIAEQHAVTFAAGMAAEGLNPFCAIYSSFLQRAYDQIIHDCALQKLPVRFAMDRAGLVGADGATHAGAYDVSYLACVPGIVLMAPSDEAELMHCIATANAIDDMPSAFRYPRGNGVGVELPAGNKGTPMEIGKGRILREGTDVAFLCYGTIAQTALKAADLLTEHGLSATVADARFCKPLDTELVRELFKNHRAIITVEEGSVGGFGSTVLHYMTNAGMLDLGYPVRNVVLPDTYIDHGTPADQAAWAGLTGMDIAATAMKACGKEGIVLPTPSGSA